MRNQIREGLKLLGVFEISCYGSDGKLKWRDWIENRVVNEGLDYILESLFESTTSAFPAVDPWYVGLTDGTPTTAAGDTLAAHAGWTEVTDYAGDRKEFVNGAVSGQSVDNSASKASFAINATVTIGGAFLCEPSTGNTGVLLCVEAFTGGDKSADNGDTLEVQYTISAADA